MVLLVAREAAAAETSAARLRALGVAAIAAPVSRVVWLAWTGPAPQAQALAFTSRHGVAAFAAARPERGWPCYAVGPATAAEARAQGFTAVIEGPADGAALAALLRERLAPDAGEVVHVGGDRLAFDVAASLRGAGFAARHCALYRTEDAEALAGDARARLAAGEVDGVLVYSPRGATAFRAQCVRAGLAQAAEALRWLCLSEAVAQAAREAGARRISIASAPREEALFGAALARRQPD